MKDIFAALTHACEKISENGPLKAGNYNTLKRMVTECTIAFESKHGSIENVPAVQYHLNEISSHNIPFQNILDISLPIEVAVILVLFSCAADRRQRCVLSIKDHI